MGLCEYMTSLIYSVHSESKASQGYIVRPGPKIKLVGYKRVTGGKHSRSHAYNTWGLG